MTHGLLASGLISPGNLEVEQIGSDVYIPSDGPWMIHHIWGVIVPDAAVYTAGTLARLVLEPPNGDIEPDPAPGRFPLIGPPYPQTTTGFRPVAKTNMYEVEWTAYGKAALRFNCEFRSVGTFNMYAAGGVIFGKSPPTKRRSVHMDSVDLQLTVQGENEIGSIDLSERATRITEIRALLYPLTATADANAALATIRLDSDDIPISPAQFPCTYSYGIAQNDPTSDIYPLLPEPIYVDIPVVGGARITCYCDLVSAANPQSFVAMIAIGYI